MTTPRGSEVAAARLGRRGAVAHAALVTVDELQIMAVRRHAKVATEDEAGAAERMGRRLLRAEEPFAREADGAILPAARLRRDSRENSLWMPRERHAAARRDVPEAQIPSFK